MKYAVAAWLPLLSIGCGLHTQGPTGSNLELSNAEAENALQQRLSKTERARAQILSLTDATRPTEDLVISALAGAEAALAFATEDDGLSESQESAAEPAQGSGTGESRGDAALDLFQTGLHRLRVALSEASQGWVTQVSGEDWDLERPIEGSIVGGETACQGTRVTASGRRTSQGTEVIEILLLDCSEAEAIPLLEAEVAADGALISFESRSLALLDVGENRGACRLRRIDGEIVFRCSPFRIPTQSGSVAIDQLEARIGSTGQATALLYLLAKDDARKLGVFAELDKSGHPRARLCKREKCSGDWTRETEIAPASGAVGEPIPPVAATGLETSTGAEVSTSTATSSDPTAGANTHATGTESSTQSSTGTQTESATESTTSTQTSTESATSTQSGTETTSGTETSTESGTGTDTATETSDESGTGTADAAAR